jgi:hypothetical protein
MGDKDVQDAYEADDSSLNPSGNEHKEVTETEDDDITYVSHTFTYRICCIGNIFCTCHIHLSGVTYLRTESSLTLFSALLESSGISEANSSTLKEITLQSLKLL